MRGTEIQVLSQELSWFFMTTHTFCGERDEIAAQRYEPSGGSGGYDPYTNRRLVKLVWAAIKNNGAEYRRIWRILERIVERDGERGRTHLVTLERAFGKYARDESLEKEFRWPLVALFVPAIESRARQIAEEVERERILTTTYETARIERCSPVAVAMRVLDTDRLLILYGVPVNAGSVQDRYAALERAMKAKEDVFLRSAKEEMFAEVDAAMAAYRAASSDFVSAHRARREEDERKKAELRAELGAKRRAKEKSRFEARLRRAS